MPFSGQQGYQQRMLYFGDDSRYQVHHGPMGQGAGSSWNGAPQAVDQRYRVPGSSQVPVSHDGNQSGSQWQQHKPPHQQTSGQNQQVSQHSSRNYDVLVRNNHEYRQGMWTQNYNVSADQSRDLAGAKFRRNPAESRHIGVPPKRNCGNYNSKF